MRSGSGNDDKRKRISVISSHFATPTIPMASSEKDAALAAVPSDSPTMYDSFYDQIIIFIIMIFVLHYCTINQGMELCFFFPIVRKNRFQKQNFAVVFIDSF